MKKHILIATALLIGAPALAHIEPGTYKGTYKNQVCSMVVVKQYYENDTPHPLNERVVVRAANAEFLMGHPPVVDAATATASFNHDIFQGVLPTEAGAQALVIEMDHAAHMPKNFTWIENFWRAGSKVSERCDGLKREE